MRITQIKLYHSKYKNGSIRAYGYFLLLGLIFIKFNIVRHKNEYFISYGKSSKNAKGRYMDNAWFNVDSKESVELKEEIDSKIMEAYFDTQEERIA